MGLNWRAAFSSALETGAGLMADSITRDRNLADKQSLLTMSDEMEQAKAARVRQEIASVTGSVAREVDDPTHPEGKRRLSDAEWNAAVADRFTQEGRVGEAKYYQEAADKLSDNARQTKKDEAEQTWRMERARIEDEFRQGQITHNQRMEGIAASNASRQNRLANLQIKEAERQQEERETETGLRKGLIAAQRVGSEEAETIYKQELAGLGKGSSAASAKERYDLARVLGDEARALEKQAADEMDPEAQKALRSEAKQIRQRATALYGGGEETGSKAQDVRVGGVVIGHASSPEEAKAMVAQHMAGKPKGQANATSSTASPNRPAKGVISAPSVREMDAQIAEQQRIAGISYVDPDVRLAAKMKAEELIQKRNAALGLPSAADLPLVMR